MNTMSRFVSGGTRVPRVVFGVPPKTPALTMSGDAVADVARAAGSGGTPEPTRETQVLPEHS